MNTGDKPECNRLPKRPTWKQLSSYFPVLSSLMVEVLTLASQHFLGSTTYHWMWGFRDILALKLCWTQCLYFLKQVLNSVHARHNPHWPLVVHVPRGSRGSKNFHGSPLDSLSGNRLKMNKNHSFVSLPYTLSHIYSITCYIYLIDYVPDGTKD